LGWIVGWVGFVYGTQLSLLVMALLKFLVQYDFFRHPDGPAMMAIIIACTSVARDAFEIGHVRWLQVLGRPVLTFPDGKSLRQLVQQEPIMAFEWGLIGGILCAGFAITLSTLGKTGQGVIVQLAGVTLVGGTVALWSYLIGVQQTRSLLVHWETLRWR